MLCGPREPFDYAIYGIVFRTLSNWSLENRTSGKVPRIEANCWVIATHHTIPAIRLKLSRAALPPKSDKRETSPNVCLVPCVDGSELARLFLTSADWSVQPCVRPICAVDVTAGHNALRGSGPGQKPAFDDAPAQVGCPDRRIGRLCITCCSPSQPSHHADCWRDLGYTASATGSL